MSYFNTCPDCGANLDPNEACTCQKVQRVTRQEPMPLEPDTITPPVITSMEQLMELAREDWSNNSALGYAIRAMKNADLPEEKIQEVVNEMNWLFDMLDLTAAAEIYNHSHY